MTDAVLTSSTLALNPKPIEYLSLLEEAAVGAEEK